MDDEPAPEHLIGEIIASRYRIEAHVGDGSMGSVYRARHVKVGRPFAVKVLRPSLTGDPGLRRRFLREAEFAGSLHHPGIVGMVDLGETSAGLCYLVMEYAPGDTLYDLVVRSAPLPATRVISLVRQLCDGLAHAHDHGLIHRDLKPENVVVEPDARGGDRLKIIDFGIAILRDEAVSSSPDRLTTAGLVLGTPHYMAPEQALGEAIDHRVDLFALGVMCFEMLTGRAPFDGVGVEVAHANVSVDTPAMRDRAPGQVVDPLLEAFTRRLMSKSRDARPASAAAARALLDLIERDRAAAAAMLDVPLVAIDARNVLWAPRAPVAVPAVAVPVVAVPQMAVPQMAVPSLVDPCDELTELTRAVAPRRTPVAAAAVATAVVLLVVAFAARRGEPAPEPAPAPAPVTQWHGVAAAVMRHASPALTVQAPAPIATPGAASGAIAIERAVADPAGAADRAVPGRAAAVPPDRAGVDPATPVPSATSRVPAGTVRRADAVPTTGRTAAAPDAPPPAVQAVAAVASAPPGGGASPTTPAAAPVAAVATIPVPRAPSPGVALLPAVPPTPADSATVGQLYAAVGHELRALDKRRAATADLWPVYLRIRINEAMADRDQREAVDAQLHRLHALIAKRGDVHCETPPH